MKSFLRAALVVSLVLGALGACSKTKKGESCDEEGKVADCDDGLICAKNTETPPKLLCLKTCVGQEDCGSGELCRSTGDSPAAPKVCQSR